MFHYVLCYSVSVLKMHRGCEVPNAILFLLKSQVLLWMPWVWNYTHLQAQDSIFAIPNADLSLLIAVCHFGALGGELWKSGNSREIFIETWR